MADPAAGAARRRATSTRSGVGVVHRRLRHRLLVPRPTSSACRSTSSRSIARSSATCATTRTTPRSSARSSTSATTSASRSSPRASRTRRPRPARPARLRHRPGLLATGRSRPPSSPSGWRTWSSRSARRRPEPQVRRRRNRLLLRLARDLARLRDRLGEHLARLRSDDEDAPVDHERRHAGGAGGLRASGRGIDHGSPRAIVECARDALVGHPGAARQVPPAPAAPRDRSPRPSRRP